MKNFYNIRRNSPKRTEKANEIVEEQQDDDEMVLTINHVSKSDHCENSKFDRKFKVKNQKLAAVVEILKKVTNHRIEIEDSIEIIYRTINQLSQYFNHLKILELDDTFKKAALLSSLPEKYKEVILSIEITHCDWEITKKIVKNFIENNRINGNKSKKRIYENI